MKNIVVPLMVVALVSLHHETALAGQGNNGSQSEVSKDNTSTIVAAALLSVLLVVGIVILISKVTKREQVNGLVDEAARTKGANLEILSRVFEIPVEEVASIVGDCYLKGEIQARSDEEAADAMRVLSERLRLRARELNASNRLDRIQGDRAKKAELQRAVLEERPATQIYEMLLAM